MIDLLILNIFIIISDLWSILLYCNYYYFNDNITLYCNYYYFHDRSIDFKYFHNYFRFMINIIVTIII